MKRKWFKRLLRLTCFGMLLFFVVGVGGVWWAHRHLTLLTVGAINRAFPDLEFSARTVAFSPVGDLDLQAIRIRVRSDGSEALLIPSARVRFSWPGLRLHTVQEVVIENPRVRVNDRLLAALAAPSKSTKDKETSPAWRVDRLTVSNGTVHLDLAAIPTVRFGFAAQYGSASGFENNLTLNSLHIRARDEKWDAIAVPSLQLSATGDDLLKRKIRQITVRSPQIHLSDRFLASWANLPQDSSSSSPAWGVDRLSVQTGHAQLQLAACPPSEFDFSLQAQDLADNGAAELALGAVRLFPHDDGTAGVTIPRVRLAVSAEGLRQHTIQEIEIDAPELKVTDQILAWRPPASAPAAAPNSPRSGWKIQRFTLSKGQALVDLTGAPVAEFDFGLHLENANLEAPSGQGEWQAADVTHFTLRTRQAGVEPFLRIPAIHAEFQLPELVKQQRLARLRVEHLDFRYNNVFREMIAAGAKPALPGPSATQEKSVPATIGELRLSDGRIHLDDLGLGIPGIECRLDTTFRELALAPDAGAAGHEWQTIEISQIALRSPLDPFFTVLDLDAVFVRFTLAGLWRREIEEVAIVRPTLAIGPDLFWYIDRVQKNQAASAPAVAVADEGPPWSIRNFSAKAGKLLLALEGQKELALPMPFESRAENLNFRRLSDLRLKLKIDMPEQDYDYPGYELALRKVSGRIEFSLPPQKRSNNLVNTLRMREVRWKNFHGRDVFLDVTYDERGIYGNLAGKACAGLIRGQFNFLLTPQSDWNGWVSGSDVDLRQMTDIIVPEKFSLTGPADFRLTVAARAREIRRVDGDFRARTAGQMRIGKIDEFLKGPPSEWTGLANGLSRISLEALRDFNYDTAHGDFHFTGLNGAVHLDLRGPSGSRGIEMNFHDETQLPIGREVVVREP